MIYLLDTNVVSELRKKGTRRVDRNVVAWESGVPADALYLSVVTILELELGILKVRRRDSAQADVLRA